MSSKEWFWIPQIGFSAGSWIIIMNIIQIILNCIYGRHRLTTIGATQGGSYGCC